MLKGNQTRLFACVFVCSTYASAGLWPAGRVVPDVCSRPALRDTETPHSSIPLRTVRSLSLTLQRPRTNSSSNAAPALALGTRRATFPRSCSYSTPRTAAPSRRFSKSFNRYTPCGSMAGANPSGSSAAPDSSRRRWMDSAIFSRRWRLGRCQDMAKLLSRLVKPIKSNQQRCVVDSIHRIDGIQAQHLFEQRVCLSDIPPAYGP